MNKFDIIRPIDDRGRIFLVNYRGIQAVLKKNLIEAELVAYNDKSYTDRYSFLPKIYEIFDLEGRKAMVMELLYTFNYDLSEKYVDNLFQELENFQKETAMTKLDISPGNTMSRSNGEIVLFDLWSRGYTPGWISDTIEGNKQTLYNTLLQLKYKDRIKNYILNSIQVFENDNISLNKFGIDNGLKNHYNYSDLPPDLMYIKSLYIGLEIYKVLKEYLPTIGINIKTYKPPLSGEGLYWQKYDEIENKYKNLDRMQIFYLIFPTATLHDLNYPPLYNKSYDNYSTIGNIFKNPNYNPNEELTYSNYTFPQWYLVFLISNDYNLINYSLNHPKIVSPNFNDPKYSNMLEIAKTKDSTVYNRLSNVVK